MKDNFGDRMKMYERMETDRRAMPGLPIYARIDGRGFSKFTKDMNRPYDTVMSSAMIYTTMKLVEKTNAKIGYTQTDEINLVYYTDNPDGETFFNGKFQKLCSILASMATTEFMYYWYCVDSSKLEKLPNFDCRVFQLPSKEEAANAILWREQDATKNAISMAASVYYSHKELMNKTSNEKQEMLFQKGVNFNDYPAFFKRGTFLRRESVTRYLNEDELAKIPIDRRPTEPVTRTAVVELDMPPFGKVTNRVGVVFNGEPPFREVSVS